MIDLRREGDVFVLQMDDGENRFNRSSVDAIAGALDEAAAFDGPAALVTTGTGKFYSNGLDLDWLLAAGEAGGPMLADVHRIFARVLAFPGYTVAAINGHAFAAGGMLTLAHDAKVMRADRGYFCLNEVDLAMPLTPGMAALITGRLPKRTAHEVVLTGRRYGAAEAIEAGIVDESAADDQVLPRAIELAAALADKNRSAMATLRRNLYGPTIELLEAGGGTP
jgi:Delta3-Delta2-enoyl-CoA isomerase